MPKAERKMRRSCSVKKTAKRTLLLVTNGAITEREYLNELKRRAHETSNDLRVE